MSSNIDERMNNKQPKLMSLNRMRDILEPHIQHSHSHIFINSDLAILYGDPTVFRLILKQQPPFSIDDYRLGILVRGELRANINLVEKHITAGTLVFIGPGSIVSPISITPDLKIYGFALSQNFLMPFAPGQMPSAFNGQVRDFQLPVGEADLLTARHIVDTLWHIVHQNGYNRQTVSSLVAAQMYHYDSLYQQYATTLATSRSREQTIFDRFIYLVNQNAARQHQLSFYADRMCLTQRYLGTVVRQASGTTAKAWLDQAILARIKVELRHTDKSIAQISEQMHFPTPSFFCKYFKRLAGCTPLEFRSPAPVAP